MKRDRVLICITGLPGSGKSFVASVGKRMGLDVYVMGDVVREETLKRYGKYDKELVGKLAEELRQEYGEAAVASLIIEKLQRDRDKKIVIIDGIRSASEIDTFKKYFDVIVVGIIASRATRYERILKRKRKDDIENIDDFMKREEREIGFGVLDALYSSDIYFFNEGIDRTTAMRYAESLFKTIIEAVR